MKVTENPVTHVVIDQLDKCDTLKNFLDQVDDDSIGFCNGYLLMFNNVNSEFFDEGIFEKNTRYYRAILYFYFGQYQKEIKNRHNQAITIRDYSTSSQIHKSIVHYIREKSK